MSHCSHIVLLGDITVVSVDEVYDYVNLTKGTRIMKEGLPGLCDNKILTYMILPEIILC